MINKMKVRTKSSPCGPDKLGYTRATMKITKMFLNKFKNFRSSD